MFDIYVFVDVFDKFVYIALLINVMFLKSFINSFKLLLIEKFIIVIGRLWWDAKLKDANGTLIY
jgi:hypothetical protein